MFSFISEFVLAVYYGLLTMGFLITVAMWFFDKIILSQYVWIARIVGLGLLVYGVSGVASIKKDQEWKKKVDELQAKIAAAEIASKNVNVEIQTKYKDRIVYIKEKKKKTEEVIKQNAPEIDKNCVVSPLVIDILNDAIIAK